MILRLAWYTLVVVYSSVYSAASCSSPAISVDRVVEIQKCVCDLQKSDEACCNAIGSDLDQLQYRVDSLLDIVTDVLAGISNIDTFISQYEILVDLANQIDVNLVKSVVKTLFSTGSSFDQLSSLVDTDALLDNSIVSRVAVVDNTVQTISSLVDAFVAQNCASSDDVIISNLEQIAITVTDISSLFDQISRMDAIIMTQAESIDTKVEKVQSELDVLSMQGCRSLDDVILSNLDTLQKQEAQCCQQLVTQLTDVHDDIDSRLDKVVSVSLIEQFFDVMSLVDVFEGPFVSYTDIVQSGFDYIASRLDLLYECVPTPLTAPATISVPGNYCLVGDGIGDIVIASSEVALNLNNRLLSGSITINTGLQDVSIRNGRLNGSGGGNGIYISNGCANIILSNLYITNFGNGLYSDGLSSAIVNLCIDEVTSAQNLVDGFFIQNTSGIMTNSLALQNVYAGVSIVQIDLSFMIVYMQSINNDTYGFYVEGKGNPSAVSAIIYDSIAYANSGKSGFRVASCNIYIQDCIAQSNGENGFDIVQSSWPVEGSIINCKAVSNAKGGFNVSNASMAVGFVGNYSANNTNFSYGVGGAYLTYNRAPYYWLDSNASTATHYTNTNGV